MHHIPSWDIPQALQFLIFKLFLPISLTYVSGISLICISLEKTLRHLDVSTYLLNPEAFTMTPAARWSLAGSGNRWPCPYLSHHETSFVKSSKVYLVVCLGLFAITHFCCCVGCVLKCVGYEMKRWWFRLITFNVLIQYTAVCVSLAKHQLHRHQSLIQANSSILIDSRW